MAEEFLPLTQFGDLWVYLMTRRHNCFGNAVQSGAKCGEKDETPLWSRRIGRVRPCTLGPGRAALQSISPRG
jgi:hypothetical protein